MLLMTDKTSSQSPDLVLYHDALERLHEDLLKLKSVTAPCVPKATKLFERIDGVHGYQYIRMRAYDLKQLRDVLPQLGPHDSRSHMHVVVSHFSDNNFLERKHPSSVMPCDGCGEAAAGIEDVAELVDSVSVFCTPSSSNRAT